MKRPSNHSQHLLYWTAIANSRQAPSRPRRRRPDAEDVERWDVERGFPPPLRVRSGRGCAWNYIVGKGTFWCIFMHFLPCDCMKCNAQYCCRNSVRLSVRHVYCDKTKQRTADMLIPRETAITLVSDTNSDWWAMPPSLWNLRSKWPIPFKKRGLRPISAHNVSTIGDSEKVQLRRI